MDISERRINSENTQVQPAIVEHLADLEVGDTADLEICVTKSRGAKSSSRNILAFPLKGQNTPC